MIDRGSQRQCVVVVASLCRLGVVRENATLYTSPGLQFLMSTLWGPSHQQLMAMALLLASRVVTRGDKTSPSVEGVVGVRWRRW